MPPLTKGENYHFTKPGDLLVRPSSTNVLEQGLWLRRDAADALLGPAAKRMYGTPN